MYYKYSGENNNHNNKMLSLVSVFGEDRIGCTYPLHAERLFPTDFRNLCDEFEPVGIKFWLSFVRS